jgi:DNA-binding LytR/AlgR family response regulator
MKINCLVVDDEPLARKGIAEYVSEIEFLNLVGECENALKASAYLNQQAVDLLFLDIHMPKISGIEFIKTLKAPPLIIFTTAFSDYALEGYALNVVDYLVKPITFERFLKAAQRALEIQSVKRLGNQLHDVPIDYFFVKCDNKFEKVLYQEVRYIEALQNYVIIYAAGKKLITYLTLTSLENQLPKDQFLKVHKSYIIAVRHVKAIEGNEIIMDDSRIPISRNLKEKVINQILGNNLFKR